MFPLTGLGITVASRCCSTHHMAVCKAVDYMSIMCKALRVQCKTHSDLKRFFSRPGWCSPQLLLRTLEVLSIPLTYKPDDIVYWFKTKHFRGIYFYDLPIFRLKIVYFLRKKCTHIETLHLILRVLRLNYMLTFWLLLILIVEALFELHYVLFGAVLQ